MISAKTHHDAQEMEEERERGRVGWKEAKSQRMQVCILTVASAYLAISPVCAHSVYFFVMPLLMTGTQKVGARQHDTPFAGI